LRLTVFGALGEKEHIFILLFLPYFLLRWRRYAKLQIQIKPGMIILIGIIAGIGVCLKPHFLIIWVAVELYGIVIQSSLKSAAKPEVAAVIAVGLLYGFHFLILPQESRQGVMEVIRLISSGGYLAYGDKSPLAIITSSWVVLAIAFMPFVIPTRETDPVASLVKLSAILLISSLLEAGLQGRNFFYHGIPAWTGTYLVLILTVSTYGKLVKIPAQGKLTFSRLRSVGTDLMRSFIYGLLLVFFIGWANIISPSQLSMLMPSPTGQLAQYLTRSTEPGDKIYVISTEIGIFRSVLQADRRVISKYFPAFPIAFSLVDFDIGTELEKDEALLPSSLTTFLSELELEIKQKKPDVILIDNSPQCQGCPPSLNLAEMLSSTKLIKNVILHDYEEVDSVEYVEIFTKVEK
jgi:hypothetical protein